ncbi:MAG: hypothetical protein ACC661_06890 [Verrucomicrobiales bacterium]
MATGWGAMRAGVLLLAGAAALLSPAVAAGRDVLHLKQGDPLSCEIIEITDKLVRIKVSIEVEGGEAFSTKTVAMAAVDFIDFGPVPGETLLMENPAAGTPGQWEALWDAVRANLHRPHSSAGEIGLRYGERLLDRGDAGDTRLARDLFVKIEGGDWDERRRLRAKQGRLRVLIAMGEIEEAIAEAEVMARETEDPAILLDANFVLAVADFENLRKLVEDNPRWEEDDEVRPERNRLYHRTIDQFLDPHLFHGSETAAASRGLWSAIEIFLFTGEQQQALARARDLAAIYPESEFAARAKDLLKKSAAGGDEGEAPTEKEDR